MNIWSPIWGHPTYINGRTLTPAEAALHWAGQLEEQGKSPRKIVYSTWIWVRSKGSVWHRSACQHLDGTWTTDCNVSHNLVADEIAYEMPACSGSNNATEQFEGRYRVRVCHHCRSYEARDEDERCQYVTKMSEPKEKIEVIVEVAGKRYRGRLKQMVQRHDETSWRPGDGDMPELGQVVLDILMTVDKTEPLTKARR